jgi:hypothetical protein
MSLKKDNLTFSHSPKTPRKLDKEKLQELKLQELELFDNFLHRNVLGKKSKKLVLPESSLKKKDSGYIATKDVSDVLGDQKKFQMLLSGIQDPKARQAELLKFLQKEKSNEETKHDETDFRAFLRNSRVESDQRLDFRTLLRQSRIDRSGPVHVINTVEPKDIKKSSSLKELPSEDGEEYIVDFMETLEDKELARAYEEFLRKEQNQNQFEFLRKLDKLKAVTSNEISSEMAGFVNDLYFLFIQPKSEKEINLDAETRSDMSERLKPQIGHKDYWRLEESPKKIFTVVRNIILLEMKYESFLRFQKSPELLKLNKIIQEKKKKKMLMNSFNAMTPRTSMGNQTSRK